MWKNKTENHEVEDKKHRTEKQDCRNFLKSLKTDNDRQKMKKNIVKKNCSKHFENLIGSISTILCSTISVVNPGINDNNIITGIPRANSSPLIYSIAILITK